MRPSNRLKTTKGTDAEHKGLIDFIEYDALERNIQFVNESINIEYIAIYVT